ncbi:MAG: hypothetical protein ACRDRR_12155 [Pseudonocardiaceae bacterium]
MTAEPVADARFVYDAATTVDPLGDAEKEADKGTKHNRAKVGSGRPSSLLYTYGPGAIMDLPQFTIMPAGLDSGTGSGAGATAFPRSVHHDCVKSCA